MTNRTKIDLEFVISLNAPSAIGSGFRRGQVQRTVVRGLNGLPYIPASTLKGRVRDAAVRLAKTLGQMTCEGPNPDTMCWGKKEKEKSQNEPLCLICRTFGSPGRSSKSEQTGLIWRDAKLCDAQGEIIKRRENQEGLETLDPETYYYSRTNVTLSRQRGVALEKRLFTSENTLENLRFKGKIRGWLLPTSGDSGKFPAELTLLLSALKLLNFVGGGKSRGMGSCSVELKNFLLNDQQTSTVTVLEEITKLQKTGGV